MMFGLGSTSAASSARGSSISRPVDVLSIISSSSQTNNFSPHVSSTGNNSNRPKELSSEWNEGADRLDKNQLEDSNLCRNKRRHSLFDANGIGFAAATYQLNDQKINQSDKHRTLDLLENKGVSSLAADLEATSITAKSINQSRESYDLEKYNCPNILLNLAEDEEISQTGVEGEESRKEEGEKKAEHPSSSLPTTIKDHNHNHIPVACPYSSEKKSLDPDLLLPEEETMLQRRVAEGQSRCLSSAGLGSVAHGYTQQPAKRRSSVCFGVVEETAEDETETVSHIELIKENDVKDNFSIFDQQKHVSTCLPYQRRSTSLYPGLDNPAYTSALRVYHLEEQQGENKETKEDISVDIPTFSKSKAMRKAKKAAGLMANYGNMRSDSVDSGFSCASLSSCSSTESSLEDPANTEKTSMNRQRSMSIQPGGLGMTKSVDYPAWLKSIKKLVQLIVQLKQLEGEDATEDSVSSLEHLAGQYRQDVENVKKFVRHNDWPVSHEIRADLWRVLCHTKDFESNKAVYSQQLEDLTRSGVKTLRPSFLSLDGIVVADHGLKEEGAVTLQKLLIVIECVRPEIRFVPILYPLCAMFLHYMTAEETFACVSRLLSTSQGNTFILSSELAVFASCHTLLSLLKKHKRSVYSMLKRKAGTADDVKLAEIFTHWNAWIFKHLPFGYLVRVLDCFLVEGHKMLLRVTLSLIYLWYKERSKEPNFGNNPINNPQRRHFPLIRSSTLPTRSKLPTATAGLSSTTPTESSGSVDERIAEINSQIIKLAENCPVSVQTLLDMGCAIRNFKHSTFEQRQKHYENKFREEVARRRTEKQSLHAGVRPHRSIYTAAFESKIIDTEAASELIAALPSRYQLETPQLLFRLSEHGASFVQLWTQIDEADQTLLLIRTVTGQIFGAYCSSCWTERRDVRERAKTRYFGTGESFVWHLHPELQLPVVYGWAGQNSDHPDSCPQMFMTAGDRFLIIGSGGGDAIAIRDELTKGLSYPCETFASPALVPSNEFDIDELEVYMVVGGGGL